MKTALALLGVAALGVVAVAVYQNKKNAPMSETVGLYDPSFNVNGAYSE